MGGIEMELQKRIFTLFGAMVCIMMLPLSVFGQQKVDLKIMTGPMGGAWYPLGGAIADAIQKEVQGVTMGVSPGGGIANVEALELGKCDISFSMASSPWTACMDALLLSRKWKT
jgi:TRAP-type uncharacterized transport system substrate-binding protein